jgi:hypothetical protein
MGIKLIAGRTFAVDDRRVASRLRWSIARSSGAISQPVIRSPARSPMDTRPSIAKP